MRWPTAIFRLGALAPAVMMVSPLHAETAFRFKHVIIIFQENRTPDNLFGANPKFEPGVDLATSGINSMGQTIPLQPVSIAACWDMGHGHINFEEQLTGDDLVPPTGATGCVIPANPGFSYVDNSTGTVQPYFDIAENYGWANRMFQTNEGPSFPAHQFIFGGTSSPSTESPLFVSGNPPVESKDAGCLSPVTQLMTVIDGYGRTNSNPGVYGCFSRPTMGDLLDANHISWRYYAPAPGSIWTAPNAIQQICDPQTVKNVLTCEGADWISDVVPDNPAQVLTDIQNCNLPAVSWVIPTPDESDHAGDDNGTGPAWVSSIVNSVGEQATCPSRDNYWKDTAIFITWDDWGGYYDHVAPFAVYQQPQSPPAWGDGYTFGFRVPMMVVSAYTKAGYVDNNIHDFGSILYFIEQNFGTGFIGPGDTIYSQYADYQAYARNDQIVKFFNLRQAKKFVPIQTDIPPSYFLTLPKPTRGPDEY